MVSSASSTTSMPGSAKADDLIDLAFLTTQTRLPLSPECSGSNRRQQTRYFADSGQYRHRRYISGCVGKTAVIPQFHPCCQGAFFPAGYATAITDFVTGRRSDWHAGHGWKATFPGKVLLFGAEQSYARWGAQADRRSRRGGVLSIFGTGVSSGAGVQRINGGTTGISRLGGVARAPLQYTPIDRGTGAPLPLPATLPSSSRSSERKSTSGR